MKSCFGRRSVNLQVVLGSCWACMAWKTAKSQKWGKMENQIEKNQPGQGQKKAQKWPESGETLENSLENPFSGDCWGYSCPCSAGSFFPFGFPFFLHFWLLAVLCRARSQKLYSIACDSQFSLVSPLALVTKWRIKMSELACRARHEPGLKLAKCWLKVG